MAEAAPGRVALLSIRPEYARALLNGEKRVEFRRQPLAPDVTRVVIYATAPVRLIVGAFEVAGIERHTPSAAWARYSSEGGIGKAAFDLYYAGASVAVVIRALNPRAADRPIRLDEVRAGMRPPQSFMYLPHDSLPPEIEGRSHLRVAGPQPDWSDALAGRSARGV